ncbi:MAG: DUF2442 domain-containing protein [Lacipirellulaceae bacterium]
MSESNQPGACTSAVEVTNVSTVGMWLFSSGGERFLPFESFPWFRTATIAEVTTVEEPRPGHFHWPLLDVDLTSEMIDDPSRYPLVAR